MINVQQRKLTKGQCDKGHFVLHVTFIVQAGGH